MNNRWRIWDKKVEKMYYCDGLLDYNANGIRIVKFTTDCGDSWYNFAGEDIERIVIMNNTGITDINGNAVHEGDILWFCEDFYQMFWSDTRLAYMFYNDFDDIEFIDVDEEFEVVGSIFENPHWNIRSEE